VCANSPGGIEMKKFTGLFLFAVLLSSNAMAEKVDAKGKPCAVKGILNCASGCWEDGVRLAPNKCHNSLKGAKHIAPPKHNGGHAPKELHE